jgi:hypothetical protein
MITRPAFKTASGTAVAGSTTNATLEANGALSVAPGPNAGYYTVVYQLGRRGKNGVLGRADEFAGELAAVRTTPASGVAGSRFRCSM